MPTTEPVGQFRFRNLFEITIAGPRHASGGEMLNKRLVPEVPRLGEYIGIDNLPECSGYVKDVSWLWVEGRLEIRVRVG